GEGGLRDCESGSSTKPARDPFRNELLIENPETLGFRLKNPRAHDFGVEPSRFTHAPPIRTCGGTLERFTRLIASPSPEAGRKTAANASHVPLVIVHVAATAAAVGWT